MPDNPEVARLPFLREVRAFIGQRAGFTHGLFHVEEEGLRALNGLQVAAHALAIVSHRVEGIAASPCCRAQVEPFVAGQRIEALDYLRAEAMLRDRERDCPLVTGCPHPGEGPGRMAQGGLCLAGA